MRFISCLLAFLIFCAAVTLSACDSRLPKEPQETVQAVFGYVDMRNASAGFRDGNELAQAAQAIGCRILRVESARSIQAQIEALRKLIVYKVDAILISPVPDSGWTNVLCEARDAGIPVIFIFQMPSSLPEGLRWSYIGPDYEAIGLDVVKWLKDQNGRKAELDKPVSILEIFGSGEAYATKGIRRGLRNGFLNTDFQFLYSVNGNFMRSKSKELAYGYFRYRNDIQVVFCQSYEMALGVLDACQEANVRLGKDILLVAVGIHSGISKLQEEGSIGFGIGIEEHIADTVVKTAFSLFNNEEVPDKILVEYQALA